MAGPSGPSEPSFPPGPVPSVVRTEIVLQSSRTAAFTVDGAVHWLTNFIVGLTFPSIQVSSPSPHPWLLARLCSITGHSGSQPLGEAESLCLYHTEAGAGGRCGRLGQCRAVEQH